MSGEILRMVVTVPERFPGSGTSSNSMTALPLIVAWQARTVSPSRVPPSSTSPS
jgi:hypothetical protein